MNMEEIMKSLDKINYLINEMETTGEFANCTYISKMDCNKIKADLEVLEILRKYLYKDSWDDLTLEIRDLEGCKYQYYKEEFEDYNKVKQWLEENNYDN